MIVLLITKDSYKQAFKSLKIKCEAVFALINFFLAYRYWYLHEYSMENRLLEVLILLRILRILKLLKELDQFRPILQTIDRLLSPFYILVFCQFMLFYFFAIIGDRMFGGALGRNDFTLLHENELSNYYVYINFNDALTSFVSLFIMCVACGWSSVHAIFKQTTDSRYINIYFLCFYLLSGVLIINIIIAFIIDIYSGVLETHEKQVKEQEEAEKKKKKEKAFQKKTQSDHFAQMKREKSWESGDDSEDGDEAGEGKKKEKARTVTGTKWVGLKRK